MNYPVYVYTGDSKHAFGVAVPDFPGCFAACDNENELEHAVQEAVELYFEGEDMDIPSPSSLELLCNNPDFTGGGWRMVNLDLNRVDTKAEFVEVKFPATLLKQFDAFVTGQHMTRSNVLVNLAKSALHPHKHK